MTRAHTSEELAELRVFDELFDAEARELRRWRRETAHIDQTTTAEQSTSTDDEGP